MNTYDIYCLSTDKILFEINRIADLDFCDGNCDEESPYIKCDICEAKHFLNELGEDSRYCLKTIQELVHLRHSKI